MAPEQTAGEQAGEHGEQSVGADDRTMEGAGRRTFTIVLEPGDTFGALTRALVAAEVLDSPRTFALYGKLEGFDTRLKSGEYHFDVSVSPLELLQRISDGDVVHHSFRVAEGSTLRTLRDALAAETRLVQETAGLSELELAKLLPFEVAGAPATRLEGLFFPDTYSFTKGDSDLDLLQRAATRMIERVEYHWEDRETMPQVGTPYELLILASIIEKESGLDADRVLISQVFHNRLTRNMLLQTDPTVIYGLGESFDGNLTRAHLQMDSPYNTYKIRGLPPTPIALASDASLQAAAHPSPGEYLYFVARGDGSSQFSESLEEHNAAVVQYQLRRARE